MQLGLSILASFDVPSSYFSALPLKREAMDRPSPPFALPSAPYGLRRPDNGATASARFAQLADWGGLPSRGALIFKVRLRPPVSAPAGCDVQATARQPSL